jgi:anti-sigma B factor antagonist
VVVLRCVGRLVLSEASDALRERIKRLLTEGHRIVVNLSDLEHMDSVGLALIVGLYRLGNSRIQLVCSNSHLTAVFRRTRIDTVIKLHETEDEAIAALSGEVTPISRSLWKDRPTEIRR